MKKLLLLFAASLSLWGQTQVTPRDIKADPTTITQIYAAIPFPSGTKFGLLNISSDFIIDTTTTPWTLKTAPQPTQQINFVEGEIPVGLVNGVNTNFTVQFTPLAGSLKVFRNGLRLKQTFDYNFSGQTITFVSGAIPGSGDSLLVDYRR